MFKIPKLRPGGTPLYMSPEQHARAYGITTQSDVYSFAIVLNELETQTIPWISELAIPSGVAATDTGKWIMREIQQHTARGDRPTLCKSELIGAIVQACWASRADARPTMHEVLYGRPNVFEGLTYVMHMDLEEAEHNAAFKIKRRSTMRVKFDAML